MPNLPESQLIPACSAWLAAEVDKTIPAINAALASNVRGASTPTQFAPKCYIGDLPNASEMRICVDANNGPPPQQIATDGIKMVTINFRVMGLIPISGDLTAMNFEAARQTSLSYTLGWLDDDSVSLSPTVSIADLPGASAKAVQAMRGSWMTYLGTRMADGITSIRGWTIYYTMQFGVQYGIVLDA